MGLIPGGRLVLATHNEGKLAEFRRYLAGEGVTIISAGEAGLPEPEETETTFAGNAILKAEAARDATGLPVLADDSGLAVAALDGAPGIFSARWAGPERDFAMAMKRILSELEARGAHQPADRRGAFVAVLALALPGRAPLTFEGVTEGVLADGPRGEGGFGYDPLFVPDDGDGRTFGEMTAAEKEGIDSPLSHRARAVALFLKALREAGPAS